MSYAQTSELSKQKSGEVIKMASISSGGAFRQSLILKSVKKKDTDGHVQKPLPPPVSSEQYKHVQLDQSTYSDNTNGEHNTKEEDHYGFLYSLSEKELH